MIRGAPYRFIYHFTDFFEGRDIQSGDQLVVKLVSWDGKGTRTAQVPF
jgi:hypothetical protein